MHILSFMEMQQFLALKGLGLPAGAGAQRTCSPPDLMVLLVESCAAASAQKVLRKEFLFLLVTSKEVWETLSQLQNNCQLPFQPEAFVWCLCHNPPLSCTWPYAAGCCWGCQILLSLTPRQLINTREVFLPVSGSSEKWELGCLEKQGSDCQ